MRKCFFPIILLLFGNLIFSQNKTGYLTKNGAWCWFSDPRAILVDDVIFTGWVKSNGTIEASKFHITNLEVSTAKLFPRFEKDDHNSPSFVFTSDSTLLAMYTKHSKQDFFISKLKDYKNDFEFDEPKRIYPISRKENLKYRKRTIAYANPIKLEEENNRIYCFGRWTGFKPNIMWSDDNGKSWTKSKVFITEKKFNKRKRPYVKYSSDNKSKIHIVYTDGHPKEEKDNSLYYAYYENGTFYKANGNKITSIDSIPFRPRDASIVYQPQENTGRAWLSDISQDKKGNPVILFTKSPTVFNHQYWYAMYKDGKWNSYKICDSGRWFPDAKRSGKETEPYYFGNMTIHPDNSNVVYLSRQINGIFEIERWETNDNGKKWNTEAITKNSKYNNVRPFLPRGLKANQDEIVLWMENKEYESFIRFKTAIKYLIRK